MNNKYFNSKIYRIYDDLTNICYIGSTCESLLSRRLAQHKSGYKRYLRGLVHYNTCYKVLENNNYTISLLESVNCTCKDDLLKRERYYIDNTENVVNKNLPSRTKKEYYKDNKERIIIQIINNRNNNIENYRQYQKEYQKKYRQRNKITI